MSAMFYSILLDLDYGYLKGVYRDPFPKTNLNGGFIADKVPLCVDLPEKHFLRKGATYRLLGSSPQPDFHEYGQDWHYWNDLSGPGDVFMLDSTSSLRKKLSSEDIIVTLDATIPCSDQECNLESLNVVQIARNPPIYYEYVRQSCVELSFYDSAKKISSHEHKSMCANPKISDAAYNICCDFQDAYYNDALAQCYYAFEKVSFDEGRSRCRNKYDNGDLCQFHYVANEETCSTVDFMWWMVSIAICMSENFLINAFTYHFCCTVAFREMFGFGQM
jgi:hypothetical protein